MTIKQYLKSTGSVTECHYCIIDSEYRALEEIYISEGKNYEDGTSKYENWEIVDTLYKYPYKNCVLVVQKLSP